jgi:MFS family permease
LPARFWHQVCQTLLKSFISQTQQLSIFHSGNFYLPCDIPLSEICSIYILAYATGPLLVSPLSEIHGRLWILQLSNVTLFIFNLGCAFAPNEAALITFRFFGEYHAYILLLVQNAQKHYVAGLGGSTFSSMAGSVVKDIFPPKERGAAMAFFIMGPLMGPVLGPLTGGFISEHLGYKWVFIIVSIISGVAGVYGFFLPLRETYHPVLRDRLIKRSSVEGILRTKFGKTSDEENDMEINKTRRIKYENVPGYRNQKTSEILYTNMTRPFALFFQSFILFILALFMAM